MNKKKASIPSQQSQLSELLGATTDMQARLVSQIKTAQLSNGKGTKAVPILKPITQMAPAKKIHQTTKVGSIQAQQKSVAYLAAKEQFEGISPDVFILENPKPEPAKQVQSTLKGEFET